MSRAAGGRPRRQGLLTNLLSPSARDVNLSHPSSPAELVLPPSPPPGPQSKQDVVFYGLPEHSHFYSEILNLMEGSGPGSGPGAPAATAAAAAGAHGTVTALFCRFDALALGRVVGGARAGKMLAAESSTFLFV